MWRNRKWAQTNFQSWMWNRGQRLFSATHQPNEKHNYCGPFDTTGETLLYHYYSNICWLTPQMTSVVSLASAPDRKRLEYNILQGHGGIRGCVFDYFDYATPQITVTGLLLSLKIDPIRLFFKNGVFCISHNRQILHYIRAKKKKNRRGNTLGNNSVCAEMAGILLLKAED